MLDNILEEYKKIVETYYPSIISNGIGYAGPGFHYNFSIKYNDYKETPFYYSDKLRFVHWTSLNNLSSIINNREFRLYNLDNSEDKEEFSYAGNLLSLTEEQINFIKQRYYTMSFCSSDDLCNPDLWEKYGKEYAGVAIEFSFQENLIEWENFFLSKVFYELDPKLEKFCKHLEDLKIKYNSIPTFMTDIWKFAGFFKKNKFQNENEIRLAYIFPFKSTLDYLKYSRKELKIEEDRNRIVNYIPLKLWCDPNSSYFKTLEIEDKGLSPFDLGGINFPQIKIERINIGEKCGLDNREYGRLYEELNEFFCWRLGYKIELPINLYSKR